MKEKKRKILQERIVVHEGIHVEYLQSPVKNVVPEVTPEPSKERVSRGKSNKLYQRLLK